MPKATYIGPGEIDLVTKTRGEIQFKTNQTHEVCDVTAYHLRQDNDKKKERGQPLLWACEPPSWEAKPAPAKPKAQAKKGAE